MSENKSDRFPDLNSGGRYKVSKDSRCRFETATDAEITESRLMKTKPLIYWMRTENDPQWSADESKEAGYLVSCQCLCKWLQAILFIEAWWVKGYVCFFY